MSATFQDDQRLRKITYICMIRPLKILFFNVFATSGKKTQTSLVVLCVFATSAIIVSFLHSGLWPSMQKRHDNGTRGEKSTNTTWDVMYHF